MNSTQRKQLFSPAECEILKKACEKFGFEKQCAKAVEEHCGLITEVYKYGGKGLAINCISCNPAPSISAEVANCMIMQTQMDIFEGAGDDPPTIVYELEGHCEQYILNYYQEFPQEVRDQLAFKLERLEKLIAE